MTLVRVERRVCSNSFGWAKNKAVKISIKNILSLKLHLSVFENEIIPYLEDVVAVVVISLNESVEPRLKSINQALVMHCAVIVYCLPSHVEDHHGGSLLGTGSIISDNSRENDQLISL